MANRNSAQSDHIHSAWLVSLQSVIWTMAASAVAIALGITGDSAVLVAFGAIGLVDALGSVALVFHFRHARRLDELSDRLENIAHRVVVTGLFVVGAGAVIVGFVRLIVGSTGGSSNAGTALAAISLVALVVLSLRKQVLARRVGSNALLADGRLSGVGAMQAAVTLFGTAAASWFSWNWADALAASLVGLVALGVARDALSRQRTESSNPNRS